MTLQDAASELAAACYVVRSIRSAKHVVCRSHYEVPRQVLSSLRRSTIGCELCHWLLWEASSAIVKKKVREAPGHLCDKFVYLRLYLKDSKKNVREGICEVVLFLSEVILSLQRKVHRGTLNHRPISRMVYSRGPDDEASRVMITVLTRTMGR